jgi:hypothetical protein
VLVVKDKDYSPCRREATIIGEQDYRGEWLVDVPSRHLEGGWRIPSSSLAPLIDPKAEEFVRRVTKPMHEEPKVERPCVLSGNFPQEKT